jgi:hypothetical protein
MCESCNTKFQNYASHFGAEPAPAPAPAPGMGMPGSQSGSGVSSLTQWETLRSYIRHMYIQSSAQKNAASRPDYQKACRPAANETNSANLSNIAQEPV